MSIETQTIFIHIIHLAIMRMKIYMTSNILKNVCHMHSLRFRIFYSNGFYLRFSIFLVRLKLDKVSTVKIAATDPDDDWVKCGKSEYIESGVFAVGKGHTLPGVTIDEVIDYVNDFNSMCVFVCVWVGWGVGGGRVRI